MNRIKKLLVVGLALAGLAFVGCGDSDKVVGGKNNNTPNTSVLAGVWDDGGVSAPELLSLLGERYGTGSSDSIGIKVVFTEKTISAWHYAKDYHYSIPSFGIDTTLNYEEKFYDNNAYVFDAEDGKLKISGVKNNLGEDDVLETPVTFSNDTLTILLFIPNETLVPFPNNFNSITLYKR
jgi:hypothetical protein